MGTYGRNFEFRVPPVHGERGGRYVLAGDTDLPIGAPVAVSDVQDPSLTGALPVELATGATAPIPGQHGILVYEHLDLNYLDPVYYNYSDRGEAPVGKMVQVVAGGRVKVVMRNTADRTFLQTREYTGRVMVAPANLAGLTVGSGLRPGTGNDTAGYWAATGVDEDAWLIIEQIDAARGEIEARINF